jgi:AcrR family transcriptional regulator
MPKTKLTRSARCLHRRTPNAAGRRTRAAILESAERVLVEHGHRGLTLRAIASDCGITIGNLHYHFSSIDALAVTLVDSALQRYRSAFEQQLSELDLSSAERFVDLAGWLVLDAAVPETNRLFRAFWALESGHAPVAEAMARFYWNLTRMVAAKLRAVFPHVAPRQLLQIARLMAVLSEGSGIVGGCRGHDRIAKRAAAKELAAVAREAVRLQLSQLSAGKDSESRSEVHSN